MNVRRIATASGSAIASGLTISTSSCCVRSAPRFAFAAKESGRAFSRTRASGGQLGGDAAGDVRDHEQLVDLRRERRQRLLELRRVAVRDDDGGDLHPSTSR